MRAASGATTTSSAPGAGVTIARRVHDAADGADGRRRRLHRDDSLALDLLRRLAGCSRRASGSATSDQQGDIRQRAIRLERHGSGAPIARSRSASADWNCDDRVERAQAHVARGLQRLQQRGDARLPELIESCASCSTCCACGRIRSR